MASSRSNNSEIAVLQTEMENANKKLDALADGFEKLREDVITAVANSVTRATLEAEITKVRTEVDQELNNMRKRHLGETLMAILGSTVITYLVTYFFEHR